MRHLTTILLAATIGIAEQLIESQARRAGQRTGADVYKGRRADSVQELRELPPPQRPGPDVAPDLPRRAQSCGRYRRRVGSAHAAVARRCAAGTFHNDRRLSEADKQTIQRWVAANTPEGNRSDLPRAPEFSTGWTVGSPDVVVTMPTSYRVPAKGVIDNQDFEVPTNFTEDKFVQAIEIRPGAREVVHHVLVYARPPEAAGAAPTAGLPGAGTPAGPPPLLIRRQDHAPPSTQVRTAGRVCWALLATTAPGTNVKIFPQGTALRVRAGSVVTSRCTTPRTVITPSRIAQAWASSSRKPRHPKRSAPLRSRTASFGFPRAPRTSRCPRRSAFVRTCASGNSFHTRICAESAGSTVW